jgi:co-chaperonin GroES (HSP10)
MDLTKEKDLNEFLDIKLDYEPLRDEVVLNYPTKKERDELNKTRSGITLTTKDNLVDDYIHTVLAVGPDVKYVKVGDRVLIRKVSNGHTILTVNEKSFVQVTEFNIYGKVKNENKKNVTTTSGLLL